MKHRRADRVGLRAILSLVLSLLLAIQASSASVPVLSKAIGGGIEVVICGTGGLHTITLDIGDGTSDEIPKGEVTGECPFCIVGLAIFFDPPVSAVARAEIRAILYGIAALPATPRWREYSRAIRAPPLTA